MKSKRIKVLAEKTASSGPDGFCCAVGYLLFLG